MSEEKEVKEREYYIFSVNNVRHRLEVIEPTLSVDSETYFVLGDKMLGGHFQEDTGQFLDTTTPRRIFKGIPDEGVLTDIKDLVIYVSVFIVLGRNPSKDVLEHFEAYLEKQGR